MTMSSSTPTTGFRSASRVVKGALVAMALAAGATTSVAPVEAHHSFSIFNAQVTRVFTGVVTRVNPDVNHLQIFFAVMNDERTNVIRDPKGQPVVWAVEMAGSAQSAQQGISVNAFPPGTIISVGLHPLRSGEPAGDRGGSALFMCPPKTPPKAGKHCDSVTGNKVFGNGALPAATPGA